MPAVAAHYSYGQEVLVKLPAGIREFIEQHKPAFNLGLQGPDLLFYYKVWKKSEVVRMGHKLHKQTAASFISKALENIKKNPSPEAEAYLLGFACHFVLDSTFHGKISELASSEIEHKFLEAEIDRQVMEKYSCSRQKFVKIDRGSIEWLSLLYKDLSPEILKKCAAGFLHDTAILDSRNPAVKGLMMFAERILRKGGCFTSMQLREEPDLRYFSPAEEILEDMNSAIVTGVEAVNNIYACLHECKTLPGSFEKNFL